MTKFRTVVTTLLLACAAAGAGAQTIDTSALAGYPAATVRQAFEVCRHVKLTAAQQASLAQAIEKENAYFLKSIAANEGVLTVKAGNQLNKMREQTLKELLDEEQLWQYWRGVYTPEAQAEGAAVATKLQKKYGLTDQNWKFINVAFYKIGLDSRVIKKLMADQPKKASKRIEQLRQEQLLTIEEKGGIRVDPDAMTVTVVRPFDPNALHK